MPSTKLCTVANCGKVRAARGMCQMHYRRVMVHGSHEINLNAPTDAATRFWSKVNKTADCWLWFGNSDEHGYGRIGMGSKKDKSKKSVLAHRYSWELAKGEIPKGLFVLHKCDTPACVNPDHLFLGTQRTNVADMVQKNRQQKGESNGMAALTTAQVRGIKSMLSAGATKASIARQYEVSPSLVSMINSGKRWKHA